MPTVSVSCWQAIAFARLFEQRRESGRLQPAELLGELTEVGIATSRPVEAAEIDLEPEHALERAVRLCSQCPASCGRARRDRDVEPRRLRGANLGHGDVGDRTADGDRPPIGGSVPAIDDVPRAPSKSPDGQIEAERWWRGDLEPDRRRRLVRVRRHQSYRPAKVLIAARMTTATTTPTMRKSARPVGCVARCPGIYLPGWGVSRR